MGLWINRGRAGAENGSFHENVIAFTRRTTVIFWTGQYMTGTVLLLGDGLPA